MIISTWARSACWNFDFVSPLQSHDQSLLWDSSPNFGYTHLRLYRALRYGFLDTLDVGGDSRLVVMAFEIGQYIRLSRTGRLADVEQRVGIHNVFILDFLPVVPTKRVFVFDLFLTDLSRKQRGHCAL